VAGCHRWGRASIFGPIALVGVALNGIGWILIGVDVAFRSRRARPLPA
jgi:hypothetical protein